MLEALVRRKKKKIEELAAKGHSPVDVGTAIGLTPAQYAQVSTDDEHPFNTIYWTAKITFINRLRDAAVDIVENGKDEAVRMKVIEYLTNEHNLAAENKRLAVGYTNIKKLYALIRKQNDKTEISKTESALGSPTLQAHKQRHT